MLINRRASGHGISKDEPRYFGMTNETYDVQQLLQPESIIREVDNACAPSVDDYSYMYSKVQEVPKDSLQSELKSGWRKPGKTSVKCIECALSRLLLKMQRFFLKDQK